MDPGTNSPWVQMDVCVPNQCYQWRWKLEAKSKKGIENFGRIIKKEKYEIVVIKGKDIAARQHRNFKYT